MRSVIALIWLAVAIFLIEDFRSGDIQFTCITQDMRQLTAGAREGSNTTCFFERNSK